MSILAFGGEMGFFVPSDAKATEDATAGGFDSSFARCATEVGNGASYAETPDIAAQTDVWFHAEGIYTGGVVNVTTTIFEWLNASGLARVRMVWARSSGVETLYLQYWNGLAWVDAGTPFTLDFDVRQNIDLHAVVNSASGSLDLYVEGTQRMSSGAIDLSGIASLKKVHCTGMGTSVDRPFSWSQIIIATETTIGMRVGTIVMTGQGATHTFTTGGFGNIDETIHNDAGLWNSATNDQVELCTGTPVPSFTGYVIRAIGIYARAKKSGSGPAQMQLALRSAGTTYFSATKALDFAYGAIGNVWETNPATGVAFLGSAIASLEYGVKSIT